MQNHTAALFLPPAGQAMKTEQA